MSKLELMDLDPIEVLDWEVERLDAGLKELGITIGVSWSKSRKAHELNKALEMIKIDNQENQAPVDSNVFMIQALQQLQPPNLKADDDGDSKEHDGKEITDQNGINLPKKSTHLISNYL